MGGCLSDCFRSKNNQSTIDSVSQPSRVNSIRGHESKNRLSTLFLSQEREASSPSGLDSMNINNGLKDQTQFLKACGTTLATPIEIRKGSEKLETPKLEKRFGSSQFHSSVFYLDEKTGELFKEVSEQTPSSCLTDARDSARISTGEESQESIGTALSDAVDRIEKVPLAAGNTTGKTKSVQFEIDFDQSYSSSSSSKNSTSRKFEMAGKTYILATSMKLSDEIQTPGTKYPENMESEVKERPRIRSQFVHSGSNVTESSSISNLLEDSDESREQTKLQACNEKTETESTTSITLGEKLEESSDEQYQKGETSLSPKVKQKSNTNITHGDRPIIGMVAAHWNEKTQSQISSKWWDGNGIPNSTNKYKEDQKVSWHATSFEERLEKALSLSSESGHSFIPPKEFERDTAISKLQHSAQSKSVISF